MTGFFRFGVTGGLLREPSAVVELGVRAEESGYSTVALPDHLDEQVGPIVGLTAVAAATSTIGLATLVPANDFRNPTLPAKELASLDRFSDGRVEWGIGAGWKRTDYEKAGIALDRPGVRISRLTESIAVMKGCFADGEPTYSGDHYSVDALDGLPKPVQRPHPKLMVAGGSPKVLGLAGREADIVGINFSLAAGTLDHSAGASGTPDRTDEKIAAVRASAGSHFDDIELATRVHLVLPTDDRDATIDAMAPGFGLTADDSRAMPHVLVGTVDQMCDDIRRRRGRWGISYITWGADALEPMVPVVERLTGT